MHGPEIGIIPLLDEIAFQEHREDLEEELEAVTTAKIEEKRRVCELRVCSAQANGSGGEEQLQTVAVPLYKVRMEKEKWDESMLAEYKSLTAETKAIRPVKKIEAELVPGKLVCVIKADEDFFGPRQTSRLLFYWLLGR